MSNLVDVKVPDLGGSAGVPIIEILVKDGDSIVLDGVLLVLESDKATMEVPSPAAGVVRNLAVKVGQKLSQGDVICQLEVQAATASPPSPASGGRGAGGEGAVASPAVAATPPTPKAALSPTPLPPAAGEGLKAAAPTQTKVLVPDIGSFKDIPVIELLVTEGQAVEKDAPLLVLESDKSTMEVPAPSAGTIRGLAIKVGQKINPGDFICNLEGAASADPVIPAPDTSTRGQATAGTQASVAVATPPAAPTATLDSRLRGNDSEASTASSGESHAGPATRKFARELGVDLSQVKGSGLKGRITVEDVQAHVKTRMSAPAAAASANGGSGIPPIPAQDFSQFGPVERKELVRIRKLSAAHLSRAWLNIPHVTQFDEADITELEAFRKTASEDTGIKLTLLPFLMKAVAVALKAFPEFNSSLSPEGDALILKGYCHIGFAADTPNGLVVPVVRDVWSKGISALAQECSELAKKARDGKLKPDEMRGGCFSISSLGGLGVTGGFTPIVNAPEVAILGVSKASLKPVWDGKAFAPRLMLPLSLSYDHRVIDGAQAARFTVALVKLVADLRRLVL